MIANAIAEPLNIPAFVVDPVVVDEMEEIAKIPGLPEITRRSIFHALNQMFWYSPVKKKWKTRNGCTKSVERRKTQRMQGGRVIKSLDDLLKEVQG